jgi:hypothetical protein
MSSDPTPAPDPEETHTRATMGRSWPRPRLHEWLLLAIGLVLVNHYAWLLDDAFVYFRYVDNWVLLDYGLVYNRGEFVEGFTSPAWALLLSVLRATGLDYWHIIRLLGLVTFTGSWWMLVLLDRELSPHRRAEPSTDGRTGARNPLVLNFPLIYLGLNYGVLCYFTSGVETPLVQLAAVAYALHLARPERPIPTLLVGVSPLIRPELALALVMVSGWTWHRTRRIPWRLLGVAGLTLGSWLVVRVVYYAELLPNTFYLKDLHDWGQGLIYLNESLTTYGAYFVAALFAALAFTLRRRGVDIDAAPRIAMLAIALAIAGYFVRVGGDPRHYRYLAFSFCLASASLAGLAEHALESLAPRWIRRNRQRLALGAIVLALGAIVATLHPPQLGAHPIFGDVPHTMRNGINDAAYHRNHERLAISPWSMERVQEHDPQPLEAADYPEVTNTGWCEWAYRIPNLRVIQNLGLTDPILARVEIPHDRPAHKTGLQPMALDIEAVHRSYTAAPGMYRMAVESGHAAPWIRDNLESIELIERKIYNRHDPLENLWLVTLFPARIEP